MSAADDKTNEKETAVDSARIAAVALALLEDDDLEPPVANKEDSTAPPPRRRATKRSQGKLYSNKGYLTSATDQSANLSHFNTLEVSSEFTAATLQAVINFALDESVQDEKGAMDFVVARRSELCSTETTTTTQSICNQKATASATTPAVESIRPGAYHQFPGQVAERLVSFRSSQYSSTVSASLVDSEVCNSQPITADNEGSDHRSAEESDNTFDIESQEEEQEVNQNVRLSDTEGLVEARPVPERYLDGSNVFRASQLNLVALDNEAFEEGERKEETARVSLGLVAAGCFTILFALTLVVIFVVVMGRAESDPTPTLAHDSSLTMITNHPILLSPNETYVLFHLPRYTLETIQQDTSQTSPQTRAYQWLGADPNLFNYTIEKLQQRYALATLYYATNGENWNVRGEKNFTKLAPVDTGIISSPIQGGHYVGATQTTGGGETSPPEGPPPVGFTASIRPPPGGPGGPPGGPGGLKVDFYNGLWLDYEIDECKWYTKNNLVNVPLCDEFGTYFSLFLNANNLTGTIPPEIALLSKLNGIMLSRNSLEGTIPPQIFYSLHHFDVVDNKLSGTIPTEIGLLNQSLRAFHLDGNRLRGTIPTEIEQFSVLRQLMLSDNELTGKIPTELGTCRSLTVLVIGGNDLDSAIPSELGLLSLADLRLGGNDLTSTIPSELGTLSSLTFLDVAGNTRLSGTIPIGLGVSRNVNGTAESLVQEVNLIGTRLSGVVPREWCQTDTLVGLQFDCSAILCGCDCEC